MDIKTSFQKIAISDIKPSGWLYRQLKIQAEGLSGNLDRIWPEVRDSAYIGGTRRAWESVPYWLDGFIPLAYLLDDDDMKTRAKYYIDAILQHQSEDGWLCVCPEEDRKAYDCWALFLLTKVLVLYHECSGDARIYSAIYNAFRQFDKFIDETPLFNYASDRWFESLIAIRWLYLQCGEEWILQFAKKLFLQGKNYRVLFANPKMKAVDQKWSRDTHVVNIAMAIKSEALYSFISGDDPDDLAEAMYTFLMKYHGTGIGHFTGDECLAGTSPIRGTELCSIVEAMYSYEILFELTGKTKWIDRLEKLAYNSLPATISSDMWTHQYDQLVNQISCCPMERPHYGSNNGEANLFGLEPHFFCCTGNFNQGWPKFAMSTFYRSERGFVSASLAPSIVQTIYRETPVKITLETLYPFREALIYTVETETEVSFDLDVRVPVWVKRVTVNGNAVTPIDGYINLGKAWNGKQVLEVQFSFECCFEKRPSGMNLLRRGALYYSLPIEKKVVIREYTKKEVERKFPYCDYEYYPVSSWNFAYASTSLKVLENDNIGSPFSVENPPIRIAAKMVRIPWETHSDHHELCSELPKSLKPISYQCETVLLQPYGCTDLRMTELPLLEIID